MNQEIQNIGKKWTKNLPNHWKVDRIKDLCERITGGGTPKSSMSEYWIDGDIIWISPTDFGNQKGIKYIATSAKKITELGLKKSSANLLPKGTVIMSSRASIGEPKIAGTELSTNQGFISFISNHKLHNNFLFYVIEAQLGEYFAKIASGTTFMEISRRMVSHEEIPLPPIAEQKIISDYLDKAIIKLDRIIAIKKDQLEKMEDYYNSRIHEYITKGIDKSVTLKKTNIDWQGNVPSHWSKDKLFRLADKMGSGGTPKSTNQDYYGGDIKWIQSGDLNDGLVTVTKKSITETALKQSSAKIFKKGTVLIAMYGATIGKLGIMGMDAATNQACCAIQVSEKLNFRYVFHMLYDMRKYLISQGYGGGQSNISQEVLKQQYFFYPPLQEQLEIVEQIKTFKTQQTNLKHKTESQIEVLQAYRKSLIHECITGKKQVAKKYKPIQEGVNI